MKARPNTTPSFLTYRHVRGLNGDFDADIGDRRRPRSTRDASPSTHQSGHAQRDGAQVHLSPHIPALTGRAREDQFKVDLPLAPSHPWQLTATAHADQSQSEGALKSWGIMPRRKGLRGQMAKYTSVYKFATPVDEPDSPPVTVLP